MVTKEMKEAFDKGYFAGVMNIGGLCALKNEIDRLKKIGKAPHDILLVTTAVTKDIAPKNTYGASFGMGN